MHIAGIVCEYNPFHNGHLYHIEKTREFCSKDGQETAVIGVMSGSVSQRGEFALIDKYERARYAVLGDGINPGADLIFELPAAFSCSSAERFAYAAVSTLVNTGILTHLSFGSECGNIESLKSACDCLDDGRFTGLLHEALDRGLSFPSAREYAAKSIIGDTARVFSTPNDILGVEYLKALKRLGSGAIPIAVRRRSAGHHSKEYSGGFASAGQIRRLVLAGQLDNAKELMPEPAFTLLSAAIREGRAPVDESSLSLAMISHFKRMTPELFANLPDSGEGLSNRLYSACRAYTSVETVVSRTATRRYPRARIRRMLMCAFLGIDSKMSVSPVAYLRALAFNDTGRRLLKLIGERGTLPIIVKPAYVKELGKHPQAIFEQEALAVDLYSLFVPARETLPSGRDWKQTPAYIKKDTLA